MHCLKCDQELVLRKIELVDVLECPAGHGMWFNEQDLREAKDEVDPYLGWLDFEIWKHEDQFRVHPGGPVCPLDQTAMVSLDYGETGVQIDYCTKCHSVWLDQGEFEKIIQALEDEVASKDTPEMLKASLQEAREILTGHEPLASEWRDLSILLRLFQYRTLVEKPALRKALEFVQRTGLGLSGYFPP